jgi:small subunit ribosomal protein S14
MAKSCILQRELNRVKLAKKFAEKRKSLKDIILNPNTPEDEFYKAQRDLTKLPRDSSKCRQRNRCSVSGRPRAYIRKFGLSRITFRELALNGKIPGVTKSSW